MHLHRFWPIAVGVVTALLVAGVSLWRGPVVQAEHEASAEHEPAAPEPTARSGRGGSVWGAGYFPNVPLITHEGETVRFFDDLIKGKVVLINFIYTSCPDTCPMETARLLEVANILGDRLGEDVFFYSITVDPEVDTQPVLAEFADRWNIPEGWKFITGEPDDLVLVRKKLGVEIDDVTNLNFAEHPISLVMGNQATGRWMKRSPFENSYVLAEQVGRWLHNWKMPSPEERNYANAPQLRQISTGEDLFRTRCSACHTIGRGDLRDVAARRVGPDLLHVTQQRDRDWLERWLIEPDVMLEEKDPLAMTLYEQYNRVPMPNLRLSRADADHILEYIEEESEAVQRHIDMGHHPMPTAHAANHDTHH